MVLNRHIPIIHQDGTIEYAGDEKIVHPDGVTEFRDGRVVEPVQANAGASTAITLTMYRDEAAFKRGQPYKEEIHDHDGRVHIKEYD